MIIYCAWEGIEHDCSRENFFEQESSENGYCCSFNSLIMYKDGTDNKKVSVALSLKHLVSLLTLSNFGSKLIVLFFII